MPRSVLYDSRPWGVDHFFPPGNDLTLPIRWVNRDLTGEAFTAKLGDEDMGVTVDVEEAVVDGEPVPVSVITVTATKAQTAAITGAVPWVLFDADGNKVGIGRWKPSPNPAGSAE